MIKIHSKNSHYNQRFLQLMCRKSYFSIDKTQFKLAKANQCFKKFNEDSIQNYFDKFLLRRRGAYILRNTVGGEGDFDFSTMFDTSEKSVIL